MAEKITLQYFKAAKQTKRFNENQKVWIRLNRANHMHIRFKWRGKGRYVNGIIDKYSKAVGEIKNVVIEDSSFVKRVIGDNIDAYKLFLRKYGD